MQTPAYSVPQDTVLAVPSVTRISSPKTKQEFRVLLAENRPYIFSDFAAKWPALNWTPDSLATKCGDAKPYVTV